MVGGKGVGLQMTKCGVMEMTKQTKRLLSLDVLRGITVAGMILVNDPGSWGAVYAPLRHASWNGLTPTDLVFPFFMFIMGVSMFFSLGKYDFIFSWQTVGKIFRRFAVIFLIGLGITWFAQWFGALCDTGNGQLSAGQRFSAAFFSFERIRIPGVLQRLAIAYLGGALLSLWIKSKHYLWTSAAILLGYFLILFLGDGFVLSAESILVRADEAFWGARHVHGAYLNGTWLPFDPEGLLSALPCFAHVLLGMYAGHLLAKTKENETRARELFVYGTTLFFSGYLLSYGCPINKKIWSPTFVLVSCGLASLLFALLVYAMDVKGYRKGSRFFEAFGVNPLFIYVLAGVLAIVLGSLCFTWHGEQVSVQGFVYGSLLASWMDPYFASLVYAVLFVVLNWAVAGVLYKRRIFIKI